MIFQHGGLEFKIAHTGTYVVFPRQKKMMIEPLFYRKEVLSLYRRIFRIARHWHELTTGDADTESQYIRNEARRLFRRYKNVSCSWFR